MLKVHYHETGATITGDEALLEKAQLGTGNAGPILEITDVSVNAHSLYTLYNKAEYTGPIYEEVEGKRVLVEYLEAKKYVALREKFLQMMELKNEPDAYERPMVDNTPAITSQSIKPVNS